MAREIKREGGMCITAESRERRVGGMERGDEAHPGRREGIRRTNVTHLAEHFECQIYAGFANWRILHRSRPFLGTPSPLQGIPVFRNLQNNLQISGKRIP
jgi:hypothetical protein